VVSSIVASVIRCLSKAPPELSQDFLVRGMYLVGGGGLLRGLAERIERETEVPVKMSNVPLEAVVLGAGHVIEHYEALKGMFMGARR
jgi:rod shape-determining protein MreB